MKKILKMNRGVTEILKLLSKFAYFGVNFYLNQMVLICLKLIHGLQILIEFIVVEDAQ